MPDLGPTVTVRGLDGSTADVALHGGHILSWRTADGTERLFLSSAATIGNGAAIRGGVPVCFPQFAGLGPLRKHGFARTSSWRHLGGGRFVLAVNEPTEPQAAEDAAAGRAAWPEWPHRCVLTLDVDLGPGALSITLSVENTGPTDLSFTGALHTYLLVDDVTTVRVHGLDGCAVHGGGRIDGPIGFGDGRRDVDLSVLRARGAVTVEQPTATMICAQTGFPDAVVWNVGEDLGASMADLGHGEWRSYVCVEAAAVESPVVVAAGERWRGSQTLVALGSATSPSV